MNLSDYSGLDAVGLAALIRSGEISARQVSQTAYSALQLAGTTLNAFADGPWEPLEYDSEGPLSGVPFVLKDLSCPVRGIPSKAGSLLTGKGLVSESDGHLTTKFRQAGLAIMGLTTTDELGFGANTSTPLCGATLNPWDPQYSPGGSSGGSGVLVAAGAVPAAHASDAGGSIRVPASVLGLVGLKPSRGRIPVGPDKQESHWGLATDFVLTRSIRDAAAFLDATSGFLPGDRFIVQQPEGLWLDAIVTPPKQLRIAIDQRSWSGYAVAPEILSVLDETGIALETMGHHCENVGPRFDWLQLLDCIQIFGCTAAEMAVSELERRTGLRAENSVQPIIQSYRILGKTYSWNDLNRALNHANTITRLFGSFFENWDVLVTPCMTIPRWRSGDLNPASPAVDALEWMSKMFDIFCYCPVYNITGTPAVSLPLGWTKDGFPIGVQIACRMCDEVTLFKVSAQLEEALPWIGHQPKLHISVL